MPRRVGPTQESALTRAVNAVFTVVRLAEFEILFVVFFLIAYLIFKDLGISPEVKVLLQIGLISQLDHIPTKKTSRPEYNQIFVKKPKGSNFWPY